MGKDYLKIKEVIKQQGFTYESLGNAVGLTKTSIARIASGEQTPSFDTLKKMSEILNVEIGDFFKSDQSNKPLYTKDENGNLIEIGYLKN